MHPLASTLLAAANAMTAGILPFAGGLCDQPAGVMEGVSLVMFLQHEHEERQRKAAERRKVKR